MDEEEFVIFKNERFVILQLPNLAKIQIELGSIVFCDATFFIAPKFAFQAFITRVYSDKFVFWNNKKKAKNKNFIEFLDYFEEQYMIK